VVALRLHKTLCLELERVCPVIIRQGVAPTSLEIHEGHQVLDAPLLDEQILFHAVMAL